MSGMFGLEPILGGIEPVDGVLVLQIDPLQGALERVRAVGSLADDAAIDLAGIGAVDAGEAGEIELWVGRGLGLHRNARFELALAIAPVRSPLGCGRRRRGCLY